MPTALTEQQQIAYAKQHRLAGVGLVQIKLAQLDATHGPHSTRAMVLRGLIAGMQFHHLEDCKDGSLQDGPYARGYAVGHSALPVCRCGHFHDGDVCDDCPCALYNRAAS